MADLNIALILRFVDQATAPARKAMESVKGASEAVARHGDQMVARGHAMTETSRAQTAALRGSTLATIGTGFALYKAMQPAIAFEAQMSKVAAIAQANDEQQRALAMAALEQGARTRFSASEAAGGLEKLSAAGLEVDQSIAALPGVLDLAAASGVNLTATADYATNIMSGFGLEVSDMARVGDVLVNTFTSSNTTLDSVAATMGYAAPAAGRLGVEIEQVAAMTGLLGDQAISGERAGTALRGIMARLSGPSTAASSAFERMNIQLSDADGNLRPLLEIFADMDTAMADMGSATRGELMNTIFGMQAANEAAILIDAAGTGALQNYTEQLRETGSASRVAAQMSENARGAMDRLKSVSEATQIALGNGLLPVLVGLAERAMPFIAMAGEWFTTNQELVTTIGMIVAALLLMNITVLAAKWGFWLLFGWVGSVIVVVGRFLQGLGLLGRALLFLGGWAIPALKIGLLALGNGLIFMRRMAALAWVALRGLGAALLWLARSIARAGLLLLKNPLFLAIAAIAGAVYLIYANWDNIAAYFSEKFDRVKEAFKDGFLAGLAQLIAEFNMLTLFMDMIEGVLAYLGAAFDIDLFTQGAAMIASLREGIWSVLTDMVAAVRSYLASIVPDWLIRAWEHVSGGAGGGSANPAAGPGGQRDMGGVVRPGFLYEINERSQEFFAPAVAGSVIKGSDLRAASATARGDVRIGDIHVHAAPGQDPMAIAREVERVLRARMRDARFALHDGVLT